MADVFQRACTILPHQYCVTTLTVPHSRPHLLSVYVYFSHYDKCIVIFLCGFNLTFPDGNDVEDFLVYFLAIHISPLQNVC